MSEAVYRIKHHLISFNKVLGKYLKIPNKVQKQILRQKRKEKRMKKEAQHAIQGKTSFLKFRYMLMIAKKNP